MKLTLRETQKFQLSKNEILVLKCILRTQLNVSGIVRRSKLPRMTIYSVLTSLLNRGLIEKIPNGKRYLYSPTDTFREDFASAPSHAPNTQCIIGGLEILKKYHILLLKHPSRRVRVIQSSISASYLLSKNYLQQIAEVNDAIKKNKVIMDVITSRSLVELSLKQSALWKRSMEGRTTGVTLLNDELLDFESELWIFEDVILMTNWKNESCIYIKDIAITKMFQIIHKGLKEHGAIFDTNEYLRKNQ